VHFQRLLILGALLLLPLVSIFSQAQLKVVNPDQYYNRFMEYCYTYDVPVYYMSRLIQFESGWNPKATHKNPNGTIDRGIGMLNSVGMADLARWHNNGVPFDPFDWEINLKVSVKHLRFLYNETGSWWSAIAAYNCGLGRYKLFEAGKKPLPKATIRELKFIFS